MKTPRACEQVVFTARKGAVRAGWPISDLSQKHRFLQRGGAEADSNYSGFAERMELQSNQKPNPGDLSSPRIRIFKATGTTMTKEKPFFARRRILVSRLIIWPLAVVLLVTTSAWEQRPLIHGLIFLAGCVLAGVATIGRLWCSLYISGHKTKKLVTVGPYSMTRNPLYFFSAIGAIGIGFATETFTVPIALLLLFAMTYPYVIRAEENKLRDKYGEAFDAYVASTPRFFPRLSGCFEPEGYEVNPRKFRSALFDALAFMWLIGVLELGEALREAGIIPSLLTLY